MLRVFLAYALSGFVALGYQVVWFRLFADWFGSTNLTFALVLCNFIGGLGTGSLASARVTDWLGRRFRPADSLRTYGLIELLIAAMALLTIAGDHLPAGLWGDFPYHLSDGIWVQNAGYRLGQTAVAVACVFLPCFFMGMTFPLLANAFVDSAKGARLPSALYGWNTLGACAGVLVCQFVLLPWIGHTNTFWVMNGLNVAIALYFLATGGAPRSAPVSGAVAQSPGAGRSIAAPARGAGLLLTCAVLSGLLAGALEGDMFKRMNLVIGNSPGALGPAISFWAILGIFLASAFVWRAKRLRLVHIKIAYVMAALCYYAAWFLMYAGVTAVEYTHTMNMKNAAMGITNTVPGSLTELFIFVGACVFVPYLLVSLLLPYVCNRVQAGHGHLGLAYGLNTVAFCLGLIGFTLLAPLVNIFYSLKLMFALMFCGVGLLLMLAENTPVRLRQPVVAVALFIAGCALIPAAFDARYLTPGSTQASFPVSALKSNGAHTTYVVKAPDGARLYFGNTSMSGTNMWSQTYMRLMAHVPLLTQINPTRALLICFGVGNTASAIAAHEGIQHIDIVDLNRNVFATAPEFAATNLEVYENPRVRLINDDGRSFLRLTREHYDLITSEPPPPMQAGVYRLYSREYYRDVLEHLTPSGMMTQWLPVYQMPAAAVAEAIATFVDAFPHTVLYVGIGQELILMGGRQPLQLATLAARFPASGPVQADLARIGVDTPLKIAIRIMRLDDSLRREYLPAGRISDERNDLERLFLTTEQAAIIAYDPREVQSWLEENSPTLATSSAPILKHLGRLRYRVDAFPLFGVVHAANIELSGADWVGLGALQRVAREREAEGDRAGMLQALSDLVSVEPDQPRILLGLGNELLKLGRRAEAARYLRLFQRIEPDEAVAYYALGQALQGDGLYKEALEQYHWGAALKADWPQLMNATAWILAVAPDKTLRDPRRAVEIAERATALTSRRDPVILDTLAAAYASNARFDDAVRVAEEAIARATDFRVASLAAEAGERLRMYRERRPYLEAIAPGRRPI